MELNFFPARENYNLQMIYEAITTFSPGYGNLKRGHFSFSLSLVLAIMKLKFKVILLRLLLLSKHYVTAEEEDTFFLSLQFIKSVKHFRPVIAHHIVATSKLATRIYIRYELLALKCRSLFSPSLPPSIQK